MATVKCVICYGSGKVTCSGCGGSGLIMGRIADGTYGIQPYPCSTCMGTGKMRCGSCGGTGKKISQDPTVSLGSTYTLPKPVTPPPKGMIGKWCASDGSWYEFSGDGPEYTLTFGTNTGTGKGRAFLKGNSVRLELKIPLLGTWKYDFTVQGDEMSGETSIMGISIPMSFRRVWWPS